MFDYQQNVGFTSVRTYSLFDVYEKSVFGPTVTSINKEKGHQAQHVYISLPEDSAERVIMFLEEIDNIGKANRIYSVFQ